MKRNSFFNTVFYLFICFMTPLEAEDASLVLRFVQKEGEVYHSNSLVNETVYINGYYSHQAQIEEFSVSSVIDVKDNNSALLNSQFRTVESIDLLSPYYEWISSEEVSIVRTERGELSVPPSAARPVLRGVPIFPEGAVSPGDTWSQNAEEVHLLRVAGHLYGPYRGQFPVQYRYLENILIDDRELAMISAEYAIHLPVRENRAPIRLISGQSSQIIYWDLDAGRPFAKDEEFDFIMMMSDGSSQEFVGKGRTEYRTSEKLDRNRAVRELETELGNGGGIRIEESEKGVLLSIRDSEMILFQPESALISEDQRLFLKQLSHSLEKYDDRDILITGHTAHFGTEEGRQSLSFKRASAVAEVLFPEGRKGPGHLFLRGAGSHEPAGSDAKNRRVEILILD